MKRDGGSGGSGRTHGGEHVVRGGRAARPSATPPLPIDSSLFFKLARVVNLAARPFTETLSRAHQLSLNEWRVMVVLASHPGAAATEVARSTGLDKMSVSRAIAGLARRGRLVKAADPADGRRTRLTLSTEGEALFRRIGSAASRREAKLLGGVGAAEQARLGLTLDRLTTKLRALDAGVAT